MGLAEHRAESPKAIGFAVITISDTRDVGTDRGGETLVRLVTEAGHRVAWRTIVKDDAGPIAAAVRDACSRADVDLVLTTGGTGIAPRDVTVPTLEGMFEGTLPGFGELFRRFSFEQIGTAAILSRATAGILNRRVVIALPGSPKALDLAMRGIVLPEAGHLVSQIRG